MTGPLDGIVVADFSRILAGPVATMFLGDFGADVIKVERPGTGDDARTWGPPFLGGDSTYFHAVNRNKRSLALDLTDPNDLAQARKLASTADVVVENFKAGTMARFGLDYAQLSETNPGLIYCSISGFGDGPGAALPGYDFLVQAMGGLMSVTGEPGAAPVKAGMPVVDVVTGMHALTGILAALHSRNATGHGQRVTVNLLSSLLSSLVNQTASYINTGRVPAALGNAHPQIAPYETLQAADGTFAVAVGNDRQFVALATVLDLPNLATDPAYSTNAGRVLNRLDLRTALESALSVRRAAEVIDQLTAAGVPAGPVNSIAEALALADRLELEPTVEFSAPAASSKHIRNPISLSRSPATYRLAPPAVGEHTETILRWLTERTFGGESGPAEHASVSPAM